MLITIRKEVLIQGPFFLPVSLLKLGMVIAIIAVDYYYFDQIASTVYASVRRKNEKCHLIMIVLFFCEIFLLFDGYRIPHTKLHFIINEHNKKTENVHRYHSINCKQFG